MKLRLHAFAFCFLLFVGAFSTHSIAQDVPSTFDLPEAASGRPYQVRIQDVLRDIYGLRFEGAAAGSPLQWSFAGGEFPDGMNVLADGSIQGSPQSENPHVYRFRLSVIDAASHQLTLSFAMQVKANSFRLSQAGGVRLVPISAQVSAAPNSPEPSNDVPSVPSQGSTTDDADLHWQTPDKDSGDRISDINQSEYSVGIHANAARACLLEAVVLRQRDGKDFDTVDKQLKKIAAGTEPQSFDLKLAKNDNHIVVTAYRKKDESEGSCDADTDLSSLVALDDSIDLIVECSGNKCGKSAKANEPDNRISSKTARAILGVEQSGASSAASAQNPFLDFFFNAGMSKNHWLSWGDVRLTTTPQQVAAFASSATNVVGTSTGDKINDLATSFDFTLGPEFQFNPKDNTRFSLIAGFGATSTLTGPPKTAPIFLIPNQDSSQYPSFIDQYPEAKAAGAKNIAFLPAEQDRFFRHYFLGFRVKNYHDDGFFPSMFDVTFGQNSAVTGGMLRHFVLGFDGSHRFSLFNKNAVYIFGSANLKLGGPKFRGTPFILEPAAADAKLTDVDVVLTSRQSNRDFYRIGFGVDLIDLFKPKKE